MSNVSELYGSMVFNEQVMRERLPKETYRALKKTVERGAQLAFNGGKSAHPARARALRAQSCGFHVRLRFIAGHGNADAVLSVFVFDVVRVFAHPENGAGI